ncbi:3-ketoacyl-CoA thiolase [compost metagenome]
MANKIALGQIEVGIAGGVDTTSDAPIGLNETFRKALLAANREKTTGGRIKALLGAGLSAPFKPEPPRNAEPRTGL